MNFVTQAECISVNSYADQMNKMGWTILKLRLKTRTIFAFIGFQKALNDELQIMEHKYFKMTPTIYSTVHY